MEYNENINHIINVAFISPVMAIVKVLLIREKEEMQADEEQILLLGSDFSRGCSNLSPVLLQQGNKALCLLLNSEEHGSYRAKGDQESTRRHCTGGGRDGTHRLLLKPAPSLSSGDYL